MRSTRPIVKSLLFAVLVAVTPLFAACSSSSNAPPSTIQATPSGLGALSIKLNLSKLQSAIEKNPKFVNPSANTVSYTIYQNNSPTVSQSFPLSSCSSACPDIVLAPGTGYGIAVTLLFGTTALGCGSVGAPSGCNAAFDPSSSFTITTGVQTPVTVTIEPRTTTGVAGPVVTIDSLDAATPYFVAGHSRALKLDVRELDPIGNVIFITGSNVNNWGNGVPTAGLTVNLVDSSGSGQFSLDTTSITSPPTTSTGTLDHLNYTGGSLPLGTSLVSVSAADWNSQTSSPISVSILSMIANTYTIPTTNAGDTGSFSVTETTIGTPTAFSVYVNGAGPVTLPAGSLTCGTGAIALTQGSYITGSGSLQQNYSVQQVGATQPHCFIRVQALDSVGVSESMLLNVGLNQAGSSAFH